MENSHFVYLFCLFCEIEGDFFKHVPSAKQSSYDLVMDSKTKTLRLLAAAWLSPQAIHVVFVPLKEVTLYRVDLKSGQWNASKNVGHFILTYLPLYQKCPFFKQYFC